MIVVPDYRGFRIQVDAGAADARWNADVRVRRVLSADKPRAERVTCYKLTAEHAERAFSLGTQLASHPRARRGTRIARTVGGGTTP